MTFYKEDLSCLGRLDLPWGKLRGCNILVTGATGLVGSCLVKALLLRNRKDYNVYGMGRNAARAAGLFKDFASDTSFHFIRHDVTIPLKSDLDFHFIIHAASNASPKFFSQYPVEVVKSNINGVDNLLSYGMRHRMKRLLFVSSGEIYGEGDGKAKVFTEDYSGYVDCTSPRSCYPSSKRAAETLCASYMAEYGTDVVIARPCHTYGPEFSESDNRVYAQFIRNVVNGEDIVMKSDGSQYRSWCYVVDCVSALLHIMLKGESGQAYNVADASSNITIRELAEMIARIGNRKVVTEAPSATEKAGYNPVTRSVFSTRKLEALGWSVKGCMEDKMRTTIDTVLACRNNGE